MTIWVSRTIIIPAELVIQARNIGEALMPSAAGMYITPLSPNGMEPATHYISSGKIYQEFSPLLADPILLYSEAQKGASSQGITLTATQEDANALVAQTDVSEDDAFTAITRLGLQIIRNDIL